MPEHVENVLGASGSSFEQGRPPTVATEDYSMEPAIAADGLAINTAGWSPSDTGLHARDARGWGRKFMPELSDADGRRDYKRCCDDLDAEIRQLDEHVADGVVADEAAGVIAEIQALLERLYDCSFGEGESLKSVVVALQSQLNNAQWTERHVAFLQASIQHLRARWVVNDQTVDEIYAMIEEHGLDPFRGTVSDSGILVQYRIERVDGT